METAQYTYLHTFKNKTKSAAQEVNRKLTFSDKRPENQILIDAGTDQVSDYIPFKNHHFRFVIEYAEAHAHKKKHEEQPRIVMTQKHQASDSAEKSKH